MDLRLREELERAGLELDRPELLQVPIEFGPGGQPLPVREKVPVVDAAWTLAEVKFQPMSRLWAATELTPSPPRTLARHQSFLLLLESTASIYCVSTNRPETDAEFERLYRQLRRHPDGEDAHPLFSYLQAAARLYLSLRSMSRAEYESLTHHLSKLARRFHSHVGSTNYYRAVLAPPVAPIH